jgi:hypothetical protein
MQNNLQKEIYCKNEIISSLQIASNLSNSYKNPNKLRKYRNWIKNKSKMKKMKL